MGASKIRIIRKTRGMTLNELSNLSGVSKSYISYIERGLQKNPSISVLIKVAKALGIEYVELIELISEEKEENILKKEQIKK
ncbi:helix-turn-helix domain-containing protein [Alkalihalobacillus trypoxylicola]|uniref:helix-turn-helix domain-containing protein n=1 Tax=Alkalihalobacillus trypoxylicola TaxID=519424 RepID=UPI000430E0EB|nr:helix-turn-helix transcriptional regulator [Alkalihalobacillus trypoxylicola]GAF64412.1 putative transcriptional regulator [Bacillus sp. TS-2]